MKARLRHAATGGWTGPAHLPPPVGRAPDGPAPQGGVVDAARGRGARQPPRVERSAAGGREARRPHHRSRGATRHEHARHRGAPASARGSGAALPDPRRGRGRGGAPAARPRPVRAGPSAPTTSGSSRPPSGSAAGSRPARRCCSPRPCSSPSSPSRSPRRCWCRARCGSTSLDAQLTEEQARYQELRKDVAELESPVRIVDAAHQQGMVTPDNLIYLQPPAPDPSAVGPTTGDARRACRRSHRRGGAGPCLGRGQADAGGARAMTPVGPTRTPPRGRRPATPRPAAPRRGGAARAGRAPVGPRPYPRRRRAAARAAAPASGRPSPPAARRAPCSCCSCSASAPSSCASSRCRPSAARSTPPSARPSGSRTSPCPADRGSIFDRNGNDLAVSLPQQTIWANPSLIKHPLEVATALAGPLGLDAAGTHRAGGEARRRHRVHLRGSSGGRRGGRGRRRARPARHLVPRGAEALHARRRPGPLGARRAWASTTTASSGSRSSTTTRSPASPARS